MRLNLTRTLGATALCGALLIGSVLGATSANAATTDDTAASNRLEGPFQTDTNGEGVWNWGIVEVGVAAPIRGLRGAANAQIFSFPAIGTTGPVIGPTGLCAEYTGLTDGSLVISSTCDGGSQQEWTLLSNGILAPAAQADGVIGFGLGTGGINAQLHSTSIPERVNLSVLEDVITAAPVDITGPSAGETVEGPRPTFSGTGEPGAEVVVKDGAGDELARTTVASDGTWTVVSGVDVPDGPATAVAEQTVNGDTTIDSVDYIVAALVDTPIVAPLVGLGALALAGVAAGGIVIRRKKTAQV